MISGEKIIDRPIRWGMVGGGRSGQIGYLHRSSALRDSNFQLLAGALDIDPDACLDFGVKLGLDEKRCYASYKEMFSQEAKLENGIEAVSIATPNGTHYEICKAAICSGLHVICEKPLCFTIREAEDLERLASKHNRVVGTMYGYAGFQTIEQARQMIAKGDLGDIRLVNMQFAHGFHCEAVEEYNESLKWRVDPRVSGPSYVLGDLGTHPIYLSSVMLPHMSIKRLLCSRQSFVKTRAPLEDNAFTMMEYDNGAVGTLWCSGVNAGSMHSQKIRVIGSKASLEWWDEYPNQLRYEVQGRPVQVLERGMSYLYPEALAEDRISGGHPEGLFEAWSNLYARFALAIDASSKGETFEGLYPGIEAGVEGVRWVENCVRSADQGAVWVDYQ